MGPEVISMQDVDVIHADTAKHTRCFFESIYYKLVNSNKVF